MKLDSVITGERRGAVYTGDAALRVALRQAFERNGTGPLADLHFYFEGDDVVQCRVLRWNLRDCGLWTVQNAETETADVLATEPPVTNMDADYLAPARRLVERSVRHGALMRWTASLTEPDADVDLLMARLHARGRAALVAGALRAVAVLEAGTVKVQVVKGDRAAAQALLAALNAWTVCNAAHALVGAEVFMDS